MLWPSTRATWKPNVTINVAYTAAEARVFTHATNSSRHSSRRRIITDERSSSSMRSAAPVFVRGTASTTGSAPSAIAGDGVGSKRAGSNEGGVNGAGSAGAKDGSLGVYDAASDGVDDAPASP